jgi:hypothetical protein
VCEERGHQGEQGLTFLELDEETEGLLGAPCELTAEGLLLGPQRERQVEV